MIDVKISGGHTYKVNHCTKSNQIYVYKWNIVTGRWDMQMSVKEECSITLELEGGEDKQSCQD